MSDTHSVPRRVTIDMTWTIATTALAGAPCTDPVEFATRRLRAAFACRTIGLRIDEIGRKPDRRLFHIAWSVELSPDPDSYASAPTCIAWARRRLVADLAGHASLSATHRPGGTQTARRTHATAAVAEA